MHEVNLLRDALGLKSALSAALFEPRDIACWKQRSNS